MTWEENPIAVAFIAALFVAIIGYLGLCLAALLDRIFPIWVFGAIFAGTFLVVLTLEALPALVDRKPPEPPGE